MSLEDRDWYRKEIADRERKLRDQQRLQQDRVDFRPLFERQRQLRPAPAALSGWASVALALGGVAALVGLAAWALRIFSRCTG